MMRRVIAGIAGALLSVGAALPGLALQQGSGGLQPCPAGTENSLREPDAQGCWFKSTRGVWRILANDAHHDSVVYHVGADNLGDASDIARRIVEFEGKTLRELMVYVYLEPLQTSSRIRRVRWQRERGYDTLDFAGRAPGWIVIDQVQ